MKTKDWGESDPGRKKTRAVALSVISHDYSHFKKDLIRLVHPDVAAQCPKKTHIMTYSVLWHMQSILLKRCEDPSPQNIKLSPLP